MAPTSMCETCKAIPFRNLPSVEDKALPHLPSYAALEQSAKDCSLCTLLCLALGCSFMPMGGITTFSSGVLPSGEKCSTKWDRGMSLNGMRGMENGAASLDFSPMKADLRTPRFADLREYIEDGTKVRPWLYGSWYKSPFNESIPLLIGLGVRLGPGPKLEDAVGLVDRQRGEIDVRIPGTYLRIRTDDEADVANIIPGRLRTEQQNSELAFSRVKTWIDQCNRGHRCSFDHSCSTNKTSPVLPTRVLDVRAEGPNGLGVRLIQSNGLRSHYIALSHSWGRSDRVTTLRSNYRAHLQQIPFNALAATFQDAVITARELGINYVWIDSLCIIQDDLEDWGREAVRMGDVYSNAYLTVSALGSSDDSDGVFFKMAQRMPDKRPLVSLDTISTGARSWKWAAPLLSDTVRMGITYTSLMSFGFCNLHKTSKGPSPPSIYVTAEWMPTSAKLKPKPTASIDSGHSKFGSTHTYLIGEFAGTVDPFAEEPLSKRGWTLQERILSRRTLHYGSDEMYWECQSIVEAEDGALLRRTFPLRKDVLESRAPANKSNDTGNDSWYKVVEEYCARSLTRSEDKLPALAGLANSIALRSGDTYLAGLWRSDILKGLNWSVQAYEPTHQCHDPEHDAALPPALKSVPEHPSKYRAPSWSWAAFDAKIEYHHLQSKTDAPLAECVDVQVHHIGHDPYGMVTGGWIKLKAPLCAVRHIVEEESSSRRANQMKYSQRIEMISDNDKKRTGSALFDDAVQLPCFAVIISEGSAILLKPYPPIPTGNPDYNEHRRLPTFHRIGRASLYGKWVQSAQEPPSSKLPVKPVPPPPDTEAKKSRLSGRFGRMILGKKKESNESNAPVAKGQQLAANTPGRSLWDLADGSTQTIVLY